MRAHSEQRMYAYPECLLAFFKTASSSVVKILEYSRAAEGDGLCVPGAPKAALGWSEEAMRLSSFQQRIWPLNTAVNSGWLPTDSSPVTASPISATQKGSLSCSCLLHLSCWHRAGDAHWEQGTAGQAAPSPSNRETGRYTEARSSLPEEQEVVL